MKTGSEWAGGKLPSADFGENAEFLDNKQKNIYLSFNVPTTSENFFTCFGIKPQPSYYTARIYSFCNCTYSFWGFTMAHR